MPSVWRNRNGETNMDGCLRVGAIECIVGVGLVSACGAREMSKKEEEEQEQEEQEH